MNKKTKSILIIIGLLLLVGLSIWIFSGGFKQAIFSVSSINVGLDGNVSWVVTASATDPEEQYLFSQTPASYTKTDGTIVTPKSPLTLVVSPIDSKCVYQTTRMIGKKNLFLGILNKEIPYYTLTSKEREVNFEVYDRNGKKAQLDGTIPTKEVFYDTDGKGSAVVQTQGILASKTDCPEYSDVVILKGSDIGNNNINYLFGYKSEFLTWLNGGSTFNVHDNIVFTSPFKSFPTFDGTKVVGEYIKGLGTAVFTITADQYYFNSVIYIPPKEPLPYITDINIPSQIKESSSSSMIVDIKNNNGNSGTISIVTESSLISISPKSTSTILSGSGSVSQSFTISAGSNKQCGDIKIIVCSTGQFSATKNCDTKTKNICIISNALPAPIECGNGICSSNENSATCPQDCLAPIDPKKIECESKAQKYPLLGYEWIPQETTTGWWIFKKTTDTSYCSPTFIKYWIISGFLLVIVIIGSVFLFKNSTKPKRRKK